MQEPIQWLVEADLTPWNALANALRTGFPVPNGFIVFPGTVEGDIRTTYEEIKIREKTHFVAVRGSSHTLLNILGPDQLIHALRRLWMESAGAPLLVQRMVNAIWCGKAQWHRQNLRIKANEGMMLLDPDTYLFNTTSGKCTRQTLESKQRRMIRYVDGSAKIVERQGERTGMSADQLKSVADLAGRTQGDMGWAIDDADRVWLISGGLHG
jgi:hypothetical protein